MQNINYNTVHCGNNYYSYANTGILNPTTYGSTPCVMYEFGDGYSNNSLGYYLNNTRPDIKVNFSLTYA